MYVRILTSLAQIKRRKCSQQGVPVGLHRSTLYLRMGTRWCTEWLSFCCRASLGACLSATAWSCWNQGKFGHQDQCSHSFSSQNFRACGKKMPCKQSNCSQNASWWWSVSNSSEGTKLINPAVNPSLQNRMNIFSNILSYLELFSHFW